MGETLSSCAIPDRMGENVSDSTVIDHCSSLWICGILQVKMSQDIKKIVTEILFFFNSKPWYLGRVRYQVLYTSLSFFVNCWSHKTQHPRFALLIFDLYVKEFSVKSA